MLSRSSLDLAGAHRTIDSPCQVPRFVTAVVHSAIAPGAASPPRSAACSRLSVSPATAETPLRRFALASRGCPSGGRPRGHARDLGPPNRCRALVDHPVFLTVFFNSWRSRLRTVDRDLLLYRCAPWRPAGRDLGGCAPDSTRLSASVFTFVAGLLPGCRQRPLQRFVGLAPRNVPRLPTSRATRVHLVCRNDDSLVDHPFDRVQRARPPHPMPSTGSSRHGPPLATAGVHVRRGCLRTLGVQVDAMTCDVVPVMFPPPHTRRRLRRGLAAGGIPLGADPRPRAFQTSDENARSCLRPLRFDGPFISSTSPTHGPL